MVRKVGSSAQTNVCRVEYADRYVIIKKTGRVVVPVLPSLDFSGSVELLTSN